MIADEQSAGAAADRENYFVAMIAMMAGVMCIFILALMTFALDYRLTTDARENAPKVAQEAPVAFNAPQSEAQATKRAALSPVGEAPQRAAISAIGEEPRGATLSSIVEEPRRGSQALEERQRPAVEKAGLVKPRSQRRVVRGGICGPRYRDCVLGFLQRTFARAKGA